MTNPVSRLRILVPDGTTNYIQNPSLRFDTTGWNLFSSTISRTLDYARFGIASLKVITSGLVLREGTYYRVNNLSGINDVITVSAYVRGTGRVQIRLIDNPVGSQWISKTIFLSATQWQRIEVTGRCSGGNDIRLYVESSEQTIKSITFYIDGAQMERKPYSTSFCDGDQPGCRWNIIQSASESTRNAYTREGGRWITLAGEEREEENLYMTVAGGLGMPPLVNNIQPFALSAGSYFQSTKVMDRIISLTFHAKHEDLYDRDKKSLVYLHELRQFLIDAIKPDLTVGGQEFLLEYMDGDLPLYFTARYDGGLEGNWDIRNKWSNSFPLRLLAISPMLQMDNQEVAYLDFQESFGANRICARRDGVWNNMNFGVDGNVTTLKPGKKGEIYAAGILTVANYSPSAIDPNIPVNRVTYWDGQKWNKMSTGANSTVQDIAIAPNGYVYATGLFTTIGGVAANYVAYWNGSTWNAMGSGLNLDGATIAIAPNGDVYVGGNFTTAGGVNARRIAKWNGNAWSSLGQYSGFRDGTVETIVISPDGTYLYVGGSFTDEFGIATNSMLRIAYYDVLTDRFTQVNSGFNGTVINLALSPNLILYACGDFTASGTTSMNRIAQLSGYAWIPLGSGMNGRVSQMAVAPNADLIAVGTFTTASGIPCRSVALWNGSSWVNLDLLLYPITTPILECAFVSASGDIYIGGGMVATSISFFSGVTYINNMGSAEVFPNVYLLGPGTLRWLENQTTKKRIFLNLEILSGEDIFIDFGKKTIVSSVRGNLFFTVLPGSDFGAFTLIPGENKISAFITNDVAAVMQIRYTPAFWSVDSSQ